MNKETISEKQAICIVSLFVIGSSLIMGISKESSQDAWMSYLIDFLAMVPIVYIYVRLLRRYPGMSIFDVCEAVCGKVIGKVLTALFTFYAFILGGLVMRNFSEFVKIAVFVDMPQTVTLLSLALLAIWVVKRGVEVLGRWTTFALPLLIAILLLTCLLMFHDMKFQTLLPVGEYLGKVPFDAFANLTFPFCETVLFLGVLNSLQRGARPFKVMYIGILLGGSSILLALFRNLFVLGLPLENTVNYPSYSSVSILSIGDFISRTEGLTAANLVIAGFVKISVCLLVTCKGVAKLCNVENYRSYVAPLGFLMVAFASIIFASFMDMNDFADVYKYYALPFQIFIPFGLCILAEIKLLLQRYKPTE